MPPALQRQLPCEQIRYAYVPSHFYQPHFLLFKLFNNPAHSLSRGCNNNRKPSTIMSLHRDTRTVFSSVVCDTILLLSSVLPTATNGFPKCVERSVKAEHNCVPQHRSFKKFKASDDEKTPSTIRRRQKSIYLAM